MTTHAGRPLRSSRPEFARKLEPRHPEDVKDKISVSHLLIQLQNHALGLLKNPMDASQVSAAQILLRKLIPDLAAIDMKVETASFEGLDEADMIELVAEALRDLQELKAPMEGPPGQEGIKPHRNGTTHGRAPARSDTGAKY